MSTRIEATLYNCLRLLLIPVIRFCIRRGIRATEAAEALKATFVAVSIDELTRLGHRPHVSRLSAMTGINRRDTERLSKAKSGPIQPQSVVTRILGNWQGNPRFCDSNGLPRPLSVEGDRSEFRELVSSVSKDLPPPSVLFELRRIGCVRVDNDQATLISPAYISRGDVQGALLMLSRDTADLIATVEENTFGDLTTPHLHGTTHYDRISPAARDEIDTWLLREGTLFHQRARAYLAQFDADMNSSIPPSKEYLRVSLGTFGLVQVAPKVQKNEET